MLLSVEIVDTQARVRLVRVVDSMDFERIVDTRRHIRSATGIDRHQGQTWTVVLLARRRMGVGGSPILAGGTSGGGAI